HGLRLTVCYSVTAVAHRIARYHRRRFAAWLQRSGGTDTLWHRLVSAVRGGRIRRGSPRHSVDGHRPGLHCLAPIFHRGAAIGNTDNSHRSASRLSVDYRAVHGGGRTGDSLIRHVIYRWFPTPNLRRNP